jgi:hypothetical protein
LVRILFALAGLGAVLFVVGCGGGSDSVPDELKSVCTQGGSAAKDDIKVSAPKWEAEVMSPLHVAGTINVAEAQFFMTIVGTDGQTISYYPGHASQTGTPVDFQGDVPFGVEQTTPACLWVSQHQEADPQDAIRIPVTLVPGGTP